MVVEETTKHRLYLIFNIYLEFLYFQVTLKKYLPLIPRDQYTLGTNREHLHDTSSRCPRTCMHATKYLYDAIALG